MAHSTLVDATDLTTWASRRDAQAMLPQLVRRLVYATVERISRIGFPSGEGVQVAGWDGVVVVEDSNAFVPAGASVWELGTSKDFRQKADSDYTKRCEDPRGVVPSETTFVFLTPRRSSVKEVWGRERRDEAVWRDVRVFDADDLETWLELAPAVHVWLSIRLGKRPEGAEDLSTFWENWSEATRPHMSADLVLAGRSDVAERIISWLQEPSSTLALKASSRDEASAIFAASLQQLQPEERDVHLSRAVLIRDVAAWNRLAASEKPLILISAFEVRDGIARAARAGHRVFVPLGPADSTSPDTAQVPRLSRAAAETALASMGVRENIVQDLAILARRSLMSLRRKLAVTPELQQPQWARPDSARGVIPAMLAGMWNGDKEGDREAVAVIADSTYNAVVDILVRWANESDPPVRCVADTWFVLSKEDLYSLLARYLTRDDLERFSKAVVDVLGTADPSFDLPEGQRWMAGALGKSSRYSGLFRKGLADTLAVLGALGESTDVSGGITARDHARRIAREVLKRANTDWRIWASLSSELPSLAEAAPDEFISAVEAGLESNDPPILKLFTDKESAILDSSPHTGLLWALETLAWSSEHLGHASLVLAKLARMEPGGKTLNRPMNSLREIFLGWHPQTAAGLEKRLQVVDLLRGREPQIAWPLMRKMLPQIHSSAHPTAKPHWRDWIPDRPTGRPADYQRGIGEIVARMLVDVGHDGDRWHDLIDVLGNLAPVDHEAVVRQLESVKVSELSATSRENIWDALRRLIGHHRSFPSADWALPADRVDELSTIYDRFEPDDLVTKYSWLFSNRPSMPQAREHDFTAHHVALENLRRDAVCNMHRELGMAGLLDFAAKVERPGDLGLAVASGNLVACEMEEDTMLARELGSENASRALFARGFAFGRVAALGRDWAEAKLEGVAFSWSPAGRAELLAALPSDSHTWDLVDDIDSDTQVRYWQLFQPYGLSNSRDDERAARKLLENDRPYVAVDLLALAVRGKKSAIAPELIADALERAIRTAPGPDGPHSSFSYEAGELLDSLVEAEDMDEGRLAAIEFAYLPLLGRYERAPKLLHRELGRNPSFFVQAVELAFRAEGEEPQELSSDEQLGARLAHELLDSWRSVPGIRGDGTIDGSALLDWIRLAREALSAAGRGKIGDQLIGQVLSGSPRGADGAWPDSTVRDLVEELGSIHVERGMELGVYNGRGVTTRDPSEGGQQERHLERTYRDYATALSHRWPRTAAMLRRIADDYGAQARREDASAELREDLWI